MIAITVLCLGGLMIGSSAGDRSRESWEASKEFVGSWDRPRVLEE